MSKSRIFNFAAVATLVVFVAAGAPARAQTYTDLYNFGTKIGDPESSSNPGTIAQGRDGNMYTTSPFGGTSGNGTVYKITPQGQVDVIFNFVANGTEGSEPFSGLTLGTDGDFYGANSSSGGFGYGTVYKITPQGKLTILHSFNGNDGDSPQAGPIEGWDGNYYGTTITGGALGYGNVYKVTPSGKFSVLHSFNNFDGFSPSAPLVQGIDGDFYGTTSWGGAYSYGTVFKITAKGKLTTLFSFDGTHGAQPLAALVQGTDGNFYSTTRYGGDKSYGTVFRITPNGALTVLHSFQDAPGEFPFGGLVQATDGHFYGTTSDSHTGLGVIYRITSDGRYSVLYRFEDISGSSPVITPLQYTAGLLFGTGGGGGVYNQGVFYSFDVALQPYAGLVPSSGEVGSSIGILGQGLTGTTAVSFNGTSASYTVKSDTFLTAIVPPGATSGLVTVTTPSGTLASNKRFLVGPEFP